MNGRVASVPPRQPIDSAAKGIHGGKHRLRLLLREVPPSNRNADASLRFVQRTARSLETQTTVARGRAKSLRQVEPDRAQSAADLGSEVVVLTLDGRNQVPLPQQILWLPPAHVGTRAAGGASAGKRRCQRNRISHAVANPRN